MSDREREVDHPKDGLLSDWKRIDQKKRAEFSDELMTRLIGGGFGVMNKKEIELTIIALLEEAGALGIRTNHELSLALGISEMRVRNLLRDARLRHGINDEEFLRSRLPALMTKSSPEVIKDPAGEKIKLVIEDAFLMQALNARIKIAGGVPDGSFSKEICIVKIDVFCEVVLGLLPEELQRDVKKKLGVDWKSRMIGLVKKSVSVVAGEAFKATLTGGMTPALTLCWAGLTKTAGGIEGLISELE